MSSRSLGPFLDEQESQRDILVPKRPSKPLDDSLRDDTETTWGSDYSLRRLSLASIPEDLSVISFLEEDEEESITQEYDRAASSNSDLTETIKRVSMEWDAVAYSSYSPFSSVSYIQGVVGEEEEEEAIAARTSATHRSIIFERKMQRQDSELSIIAEEKLGRKQGCDFCGWLEAKIEAWQQAWTLSRNQKRLLQGRKES